MSDFGDRLKRARDQKEMKQEELAKAMGLTQASISQFEKGQRQPTPANIRKFAEILGVPEEILADEDKEGFEKALLMRNIRDLSPESLNKINLLAEVLKENENLKRRGKK